MIIPFTLEGDLILHKAAYNKIITEYNGRKPLPLNITTFCDSPVGSGLGTSSSLVVSIIKAFEEYLSIGFDDYKLQILHLISKELIANSKVDGRINILQHLAAFNFMEFYSKEKVFGESVTSSKLDSM